MAEKKTKTIENGKKETVKNKENAVKKMPVEANTKKTTASSTTMAAAKKTTASKSVSSSPKKPSVAKEVSSKKKTTPTKGNTTPKKEDTVKKTTEKKPIKAVEKKVTKKDTTSKAKKESSKVKPKKKEVKKKITSATKIKGKEVVKPAKEKTKESSQNKKSKKRNFFGKIVDKLKTKRTKKNKKTTKVSKKKNPSLKKEKVKKVAKPTKKIGQKKKTKKRGKLKNASLKFLKKIGTGTKKIGNFFKKAGSKTKDTSKKIVGSIKNGLSHLKLKPSKKKKSKKNKTKKVKKKTLKKPKEKKKVKKEKQVHEPKSSKELTEEDLQKKRKKRRKRIRRLIFFAVLCLLIAVSLMLPYGTTTHYSTASGRVLDVPKFVILKEECCAYNATFTTFRSAWALNKDLEEMISGYEKLDCDGKTYYYNSKENYTITEYGVHKGILLNEVTISYGHGNSCDIDTKFKKLELLAERFTIGDAIRDGNYVMDGDKIHNKEAYEKFMASVKKKTPSTLRIVTTNTDGDVLITDLEYLKGGKYRVSYDGTRDRNSKNHESIIAYKFDHLKVSGNKLYAYNGAKLKIKKAKKYETYYLLTLPNE